MDRVVWIGASARGDSDDVRSVVSTALEVGFDEIVLLKPDASLQRLGRFSPILLKGTTFFLGEAEVGRLAMIRSAKDEAFVRALRGATKYVVVRPEPWKIIPLENLIAFFQGSGTRLLVEVHDVTEAKLAFETMEVGADGIFLIHSETIETDEVAARPFRVNAGPVHAYVYLPGGATKYLSELRAGDDVLAVDSGGRARSVVVGRVKIERRPLLLVQAEADDRRFSTIVQNAETVRFVTPETGSVGMSELQVGDVVLLRLEEGGRHFGMPIQETISER